MSTELYRKYIDIINENSQNKVQLDEGMLDSIKDKVMGVVNKFVSSSPKAKAAFDQAKQYKSELSDILKTSSSGKEVVQKIGQLVGNQQLAEEITDESIGGLKTAAGGAMIVLPIVAAVLDSLYANFDKIPETAMTYLILLVIAAAGHFIMAKGIDDSSKGN